MYFLGILNVNILLFSIPIKCGDEKWSWLVSLRFWEKWMSERKKMSTRDNTEDNKIWVNRRASIIGREMWTRNTVQNLENEMSKPDVVWGCEHIV